MLDYRIGCAMHYGKYFPKRNISRLGKAAELIVINTAQNLFPIFPIICHIMNITTLLKNDNNKTFAVFVTRDTSTHWVLKAPPRRAAV